LPKFALDRNALLRFVSQVSSPVQLHFSINDNSNVAACLKKLHYLFALTCQLSPTGRLLGFCSRPRRS
jgi:hypothetical protein